MNKVAFNKYCEGIIKEKIIDHLFSLGPELLVISKGVDGCEVISKERHFEQSAFDVKVIDTTGAGDTFNSSFLYGLLAGKTLEETAIFASAAAAKAIMAIGPRTGVSTTAEVEAFIQSVTNI